VVQIRAQSVTQTTRNVRLETALHWHSADAVHTEHRYFARSNLWRDLFPADLGERLMRTEPGEWLSQPVAAVNWCLNTTRVR